MLYIGTRKQKEIIIDKIEVLETSIVFEEDADKINALKQESEHLKTVKKRGIGLISI